MTLDHLKQLSPRAMAALAGAVLVVLGVGLGVSAALSSDGSADKTTGTVDLRTAVSDAGAMGPTAPPPRGGTQPPVLGADTATTEPVWLQKQRQAEAEQNEREAAEAPEPGSPQQRLSQIPPTTRPPNLGPVPSLPTAGPAVSGTRQVGTNGQTPLRGSWGGRPEELSSFLLANNPSPRFTVPSLALAQLYVKYAAEVALRADVLWAQMLHETGFGKYGGDVTSLQNNFAGIGATGGGAVGYRFPTAEAGVKAHIAHMVAYVYTTNPAPWTNATVDPRYAAVNPRGNARVLSDLNGRWAVPGTTYGQAIERLVVQINR